MIIKYLLHSIAITLGSWTVGIIFNGVFGKKEYYNNISNLNFIKSETLNKIIGLGTFKWIVKNSFFKYFNQKLKLKNKVKGIDLTDLRREMTFAEIGHLVGFIIVSIFFDKSCQGALCFWMYFHDSERNIEFISIIVATRK